MSDLRTPTCSLTSQGVRSEDSNLFTHLQPVHSPLLESDLRTPRCSLTSNLFTHISRHQTCSLTSNLFTHLQPVHLPLMASDLRIPTCSLTSQSENSNLFTPICSLTSNLFTHLSRRQVRGFQPVQRRAVSGAPGVGRCLRCW